MKSHTEKVKEFLARNRNSSWIKWTTMPMNTQGVWRICGEDPNCDMGGCHVEPYLETVEGSLRDVIDYAVELPRFWGWGAGGSIEKISIKKIDKDSVAELEHKLNQIKSLEAAAQQIKDTL